VPSVSRGHFFSRLYSRYTRQTIVSRGSPLLTMDRLSERGTIAVVCNQSYSHDKVREMHELLNTYVRLSFSSMFVPSLFSSFHFCRRLELQLPGDLRRYQCLSVEITWPAIWLAGLLSVLNICMKSWDFSIFFYFHTSVCIKGSWNNWLKLTNSASV